MAMSNDNTTDTTVDTNNGNRRGDSGVLGTATAGLTIRQLWHTANSGLSFKDETKALVAREWFANKLGSKNAKRSDANQKAAIEASAASKGKKK
jgi:hypothetical protein